MPISLCICSKPNRFFLISFFSKEKFSVVEEEDTVETKNKHSEYIS